MNLLTLAKAQYEQILADRRYLHQYPELSKQEEQTARFIQKRLNELGYVVEEKIAGTGLVGRYDTGKPGKSFLHRFDMDALPIQEENDFPYRSKNDGVMHACGHDGHMAIGLAIARIISEQADEFNGIYHLLFQPAEEIGYGAKAMVEEGVLDRIKPDVVLGAHLWNEKPFGWLGIKSGPLMAGTGRFEIIVKGKGGHGGRPQLTIDPIVASAQLISQLQTLVSRNISPLDSAVISVCSVESGSAYNIIPSQARLQGTIRYFDARVYEQIRTRMAEICAGVGLATACEISLSLEGLGSATINDSVLAQKMQAAVKRLDQRLEVDANYLTMVSEDVGVFFKFVPGCFVLVGAGESPDGNQYGHHHPKFDFDERAMPLAAALLLETCLELG